MTSVAGANYFPLEKTSRKNCTDFMFRNVKISNQTFSEEYYSLQSHSLTKLIAVPFKHFGSKHLINPTLLTFKDIFQPGQYLNNLSVCS